MKARIPAQISAKQKKAMTEEINRQIEENEQKYLEAIDAMILWVVHLEYGSGKIRLKRFYKRFVEEFRQLSEKYAMNDGYPAEYQLKQLGVDMQELRKETK